MTVSKKPGARLWLVVGVLVILTTVGAGFHQAIWAKSEETYKGLKLLSDVIDLVEKNMRYHAVRPLAGEEGFHLGPGAGDVERGEAERGEG